MAGGFESENPDAIFLTPALKLRRPRKQTLPVVVDSPHSGRRYPPHFLSRIRLDARAVRKSEDCFVDRICDGVVPMGVPLLAALFPRAYLDVNREPLELDPAMFEDPLPERTNTQSLRVRAGLGTIARVVGDGSEIYKHKLSFANDVAWRLSHLHHAYHQALAELLDHTHARFGRVLLINCHSMPSPLPAGGQPGQNGAIDIVLGDRFGHSCAPALLSEAEAFLRAAGYRITRNMPYAGGYICENYGRPALGRNVLQIEISRGLYMDEANYAPHQGMAKVAADFCALTARLGAVLLRECPTPLGMPLAAE